MTDKELLELAARAAWVFPVLCYEAKRNCLRIGDRKSYSLWRPLTDDGDALRLAVKLNIELRFHLAGDVPGVTATCAADRRLPIPREPWTPEQGDKPAATRRAIVRAAAEIGKAMP